MIRPPGYCESNDKRVCKLVKSLYDLKPASRQWFDKLTICLLAFGHTQSQADNSLFIGHTTNSFIALVVYVDDVY